MIEYAANILNNWQSYIIKLGGSEWIFGLKLLGGFLVLVFGGLAALLIIKMQIFDKWFKTTGNFLLIQKFPKRHLNKSWQKIATRLSKNDEANLRLALIEADNLFDNLLKQMGLPGESMADRLKLVNSSQIANIDAIWRAHKLRNQIVHSADYHVDRNEIEFNVQAYEKALKELEFID
ncbi:hypothetical protein HY838_01385 [Candidatus Azambacteria bacterium]|nr:hypothetical protein [Candidatus Azambacteria bacterium]